MDAPAVGPVGVHLPYGAEAQAWIVGALMAGRPFAILDARDPLDRTSAVVSALGVPACVAEPEACLPGNLHRLPAPTAAEEFSPASSQDPGSPAVIVPTSGSTGRPKGIVHSRRNLLFRARQLAGEFSFGPGDTYLSTAANASISGLVHGLGALLSGALLFRADVPRLGLADTLRAAETLGANAMQGLPATLCALLAAPGAAHALAGVARCQASGTAMLAADLQALRAALPASCQLVNLYGLTELPALLRWDVPPGWKPDGARIPAGRPLAGHRVLLLDREGREVPPGEVGELVAVSPYIALGEWQDGGLVSSDGRIVDCPDTLGARRLRTGDLARWRDDNLLEIVGRADRQVKIAGRRVELEEIEEHMRLLPGVREAAVVADPDGPTGARLLAAAVAEAGVAQTGLAEALARSLRSALPSYMQPTRIALLEALPRLPGGKVDAAALLRQLRTPLPAPMDEVGHAIDPRLARAWRRALGNRARPAPGVSFEEAGGDSLAFLHLAVEVERLTGHSSAHEAIHPGMDLNAMAAALTAPVRPRDSAGRERALLLPGSGGDSEPLARFRDGCSKLDIATAHYADWRGFARRGARAALDAEAVLPQAEAVFPPGVDPILLAYSYGGAVAWELAARLERRGRRVRCLILLDCNPWPLSELTRGPEADEAISARLPEAPSTKDIILRWLRWRLRLAAQRPASAACVARLLPPRPPGLAGLSLWREFELSLREAALHRWAGDAERPRLRTPATLFLSETPRLGVPSDLGWSRWCDLRTIMPVGGDHYAMLRPPHRAALVAAVEREVARSSSGTE
ncbi:non-ribosomal peptide synthetase [Sabulicella glaciei]|uniref:AMP-binding protein n=1 Tax=Sabulicella glaciei TaxID=2984948 RepID=A0ABT3NRE6_9PROT|nr:AMP-binding protein [Roseococcus sp. MDT2-1-1]MCW8084734.1 AMP-binding protein [Roseococcus sp. MDT2-1-1]